MEVRVRKAIASDVCEVAINLRKIDRLEIALVSRKDPVSSLRFGFEKSELCYTVVIDGKPCGMFGVYKYGVLGFKACIWFLGTDDLKKIRKSFVKESILYIDSFFDIGVSELENYVWVGNRLAIRWLLWLGAKFDEPKEYGIRKKRFFRFCFIKGEKKNV